jgi:hypothetical protein
MRVEQELDGQQAHVAAHELRELVRALRRAAIDDCSRAGGTQHDDVAAKARDEAQVLAQRDLAERAGRRCALRRGAARHAAHDGCGRRADRCQELPPVRHWALHAFYIK